MNLRSLTKESIVQRFDIEIKEVFYVQNTILNVTSKQQPKKQMIIYTTSNSGFLQEMEDLLDTVNLRQFQAIFIKRKKTAKPSLAEILISFDRNIGRIYDQLLAFAEQMNSTASMFKSKKADKFIGKCLSYFACFNPYIPVEIKQKFIDLDVAKFRSLMKIAVSFPMVTRTHSFQHDEQMFLKKRKHRYDDVFISFIIFKTFCSHISARYGERLIELFNVFDAEYLRSVGIRRTDLDWGTVTKKTFANSLYSYMYSFYFIVKGTPNKKDNLVKPNVQEVSRLFHSKWILESGCTSEGVYESTESEDIVNVEGPQEIQDQQSDDGQSDYIDYSDDTLMADMLGEESYSDGEESKSDGDSEESKSDTETDLMGDAQSSQASLVYGNVGEIETYSEDEMENNIQEYKNDMLNKIIGVWRRYKIKKKWNLLIEALRLQKALVITRQERIEEEYTSNKKRKLTLKLKKSKMQKRIDELKKEQDRALAPVENMQIQIKSINEKMEFRIEFVRKNKRYVGIVHTKANNIKSKKNVKLHNVEYESRLQTLEIDGEPFFQENVDDNSEVVSNIYKSLDGENYSDKTITLKKKLEQPSYISADHKLVDLKDKWVLYLDMVYPNQSGICTPAVFCSLIANIKTFEIMENKALDKSSVWIGSREFDEAFNCYKNAFELCGFEFKGDHQYTLYDGLNFNLAHISNDNVHFKVPGKNMKYMTKETALRMQKHPHFKVIKQIRTKEKDIRWGMKSYTFQRIKPWMQDLDVSIINDLNAFSYNGYRITEYGDIERDGARPIAKDILKMVDLYVQKLLNDVVEEYKDELIDTLPQGKWKVFRPKTDPGIIKIHKPSYDKIKKNIRLIKEGKTNKRDLDKFKKDWNISDIIDVDSLVTNADMSVRGKVISMGNNIKVLSGDQEIELDKDEISIDYQKLAENLLKEFDNVKAVEVGSYYKIKAEKDIMSLFDSKKNLFMRSYPGHYSMHMSFDKKVDPFPLVYSKGNMVERIVSSDEQQSESDNEY